MTEPELDRRIYTSQGFIRAAKLQPDALEAIMVLIEEGMAPGSAARKHGTSYTQYVRRLDKEPELKARWQAVQERLKADLQSEHGSKEDNHDDVAGVHESRLPDR